MIRGNVINKQRPFNDSQYFNEYISCFPKHKLLFLVFSLYRRLDEVCFTRVMARLFSLKLWLISYIGSNLANQHSHNETQQCLTQAQNTLQVVESINELTKVLNQGLNKYLPSITSPHALDFGSLKGMVVYF